MANDTASKTDQAKLGIIISMFPELHETFILRELTALERKGVDFVIYSLQFPRDPITLEDAKRLSSERTVYSKLFSLKTMLAFLRALIKHPLKMIGAVLKLFRHGYDRPMDIVKALAILPVTLYFGEQAKAAGVTHLHGHWANIPTTACWYLQQIEGFKWSAAIHGEDIFSANRFLPYKLDSAEFSVVCSGFFCQHLKTEIGLHQPDDVHLNYHGLDPRVMELSAQREFVERSPGAPLKLVSIGRLVPTKGHDTLLKACQLLRDEHACEFELQMIGSGPIEAELKSLAQELDIEQAVEFRGGLAFDDVLELLQSSDAFCLAPRLIPGHPPDGIPNVIAEAMALRIPVVTTRVSAIPELVQDGETGALVEVDDAKAMASAIASLAADPLYAKRLSEQAFEKVGNLFDQDKNINELLDLFEQYTGYRVSKEKGATAARAPE